MSSGKEIKAAFAQAATWGQAVACADGDALYITNESVSQSIEHLPDDSAGQSFYTASDQGLITCGGALGGYLRYQSLGVLLAMAMGLGRRAQRPGIHRLSASAGDDRRPGRALRHTGRCQGIFGARVRFGQSGRHDHRRLGGPAGHGELRPDLRRPLLV